MKKTQSMILFADMLKDSRYKANVSQQYMAEHLGVSKRTVQNWEDGVTSPPIAMVYDWFNVLCLPPQPFILKILYPDVDSNQFDDEMMIDKALLLLSRDLPAHAKKKLLFILEGKHGSSPVSVIDMMVANLQTPLRDRLNVCQNILINYEMAEALDQLTDKGNIRPSVVNLKNALENGIKAVRKRINSYYNS